MQRMWLHIGDKLSSRMIVTEQSRNTLMYLSCRTEGTGSL